MASTWIRSHDHPIHVFWPSLKVRSDDVVLRCVLRCVMRCVFCIKYFTMLDILEKLWNLQLLRQNSCSSCIKNDFCIFWVQHFCNWIMFEHKTLCVSRKNRNFSNFAWCVLRVKVITNLDTHYASRSVKRRRLNNTLSIVQTTTFYVACCVMRVKVNT